MVFPSWASLIFPIPSAAFPKVWVTQRFPCKLFPHMFTSLMHKDTECKSPRVLYEPEWDFCWLNTTSLPFTGSIQAWHFYAKFTHPWPEIHSEIGRERKDREEGCYCKRRGADKAWSYKGSKMFCDCYYIERNTTKCNSPLTSVLPAGTFEGSFLKVVITVSSSLLKRMLSILKAPLTFSVLLQQGWSVVLLPSQNAIQTVIGGFPPSIIY